MSSGKAEPRPHRAVAPVFARARPRRMVPRMRFSCTLITLLLLCGGCFRSPEAPPAERAAAAVTPALPPGDGPGLAVVVNGDAALAQALAGRRFQVHALSADAAQVAALRALGDARIQAELWNAPRLPHVGGLARLVVADGALPLAELMRVCAPGGTVAVRAGAGWTLTPLPAPGADDAWSTVNRTPEGNPASPDRAATGATALAWVNDRPRGFNSYTSRLAGGRFLHCFDKYDALEGQPRSNEASRSITGVELVCRDAASGIELWRRVLPATSRAQPLFTDAICAVTLKGGVAVLDAATGADRATLPATAFDLLPIDGLLLARTATGISAFDATTCAPRWQAAAALKPDQLKGFGNANFMVNQRFNLIIAGQGLAFTTAWTAPATGKGAGATAVVGIDLQDGTVRWATGEDTLGAYAYPQLLAGDALVLTSDDGVVAIDAASGKKLWATRNAVHWRAGGDAAEQDFLPESAEHPALAGWSLAAGVLKCADAVVELGAPVRDAERSGDVIVARTDAALVACTATTGVEQWRVALPAPAKNTGRGAVVAGSVAVACVGNELRAYALSDGAAAWTWTTALPPAADADPAKPAKPTTIQALIAGFDGIVHLRTSWGGTAVQAADGQLAWIQGGETRVMFGRGRHWSEQTLLFLDGRLWIRAASRRKPGRERPPYTALEERMSQKQWLGLDPRTGAVVRRAGYPAGSHWLGRCFGDIAVGGKLLSWAMEVIDLDANTFTQTRLTRGVCGSGVVIGQGRIFVPPTPCLYCYPMVRGASAMAVPPAAEPQIADDQRLEHGDAPAPTRDAALGDWPMFRADADRSNAGADAPAATLQEAFTVQPGGRCTQPLVAGGLLIATVIDLGRVVAYDAASGAERWRHDAGFRIDSAPAVISGRVVFGCHDGAVHALDLATGRVAWRLRLAAAERRIVSHDRVVSAWPVLGAVTAWRGDVFAVCGRLTNDAPGLAVARIDPATGAVRWRALLSGVTGSRTQLNAWYRPADHMALNVLIPSGDLLTIHDQYARWHLDPATGALVPPPGPDALRWRGFDRTLQGYLVAGAEPYAKFSDGCEPRAIADPDLKAWPKDQPKPARLLDLDNSNPLTPQQQMWVFPKDGWGANTKRLPVKAPERAELWPAAWDRPDLTPDELPWKKIDLDLDPKALLAAGDALVIAGGRPFAETHTTGELRIYDRATGAERARVAIPPPSADGVAVAQGAVYVATRDGRIICLR